MLLKFTACCNDLYASKAICLVSSFLQGTDKYRLELVSGDYAAICLESRPPARRNRIIGSFKQDQFQLVLQKKVTKTLRKWRL